VVGIFNSANVSAGTFHAQREKKQSKILGRSIDQYQGHLVYFAFWACTPESKEKKNDPWMHFTIITLTPKLYNN